MEWITPSEYTPGTVARIPQLHRKPGNQKTKVRKKYKDCICAFDIETSRLSDIEQAIMYVWMFNIHGHCTVVGRTWEELNNFWNDILDELEEDETLVVYVHNLSYEFQFLQAIINWNTEDVFAVDSRKVLKAVAYDGKVEFRCSYLQTNMSLEAFTKKFHVKHLKQSGEEFDYKKIRYPWTQLSEQELKYCTHDVVGLCEALETEMQLDGDNLYTIPLTSTGYVRRDAKKAMRDKYKQSFVKSILPDYEIYEMCREAFRGGNTHANRYYSGRILKNVKSADRSSSYPEVLCNCKFPISKFQVIRNEVTEKEARYWMGERRQACLMRVSFTNIRLKNQYWGCPYLSTSKCRDVALGVFDNGRILKAKFLSTTITDIDFKILEFEYEWDSISFDTLAHANYGYLPRSFIDTVIEYYRMKTELKGVGEPGGQEEYFYMKSKNRLNSLYGMMAQDPVKISNLFISESEKKWTLDESKTAFELLGASNEKAFLCYQWGVWVTAHARYALEEGLKLAGEKMVYCDTDSVKYLGECDFAKYNAGRKRDSMKSGAHATDPAGVEHYMGVYEPDGVYATFATLGAKKYAYTLPPKIKNGIDVNAGTHVTIAGVTKSKGGAELDKHGGLQAFVDQYPVYKKNGELARMEGFTFIEAGGTESIWNDNPTNGVIEREGHKILITPNVVIKDSTYTLGITAEYKSILENSVLPIDFWKGL